MLDSIGIKLAQAYNHKMSATLKTGMLAGLLIGWVISGPGYNSFINSGSFNSSFYLAVLLGYLLTIIIMLFYHESLRFLNACPWYYLSGTAILMLFLRLFINHHILILITSFLLGLYVFYLFYKISILFLRDDEPIYLLGSTLLVLSMIYLGADIFFSAYPQHEDLFSLLLSFSAIPFFTAGKSGNSTDINPGGHIHTGVTATLDGSIFKHLALLLLCIFTVFLVYTQGSIYFSNSFSLYNSYWVYILSYSLYFLAIIGFSIFIRISEPSYLPGYCLSIIGCAVALGMLAFENPALNHISLTLFSFCAAGVELFTMLMLLALARQVRQSVYILSGFLLYWSVIEASSSLGLKLANSPAFYRNNLSAFMIIFILLVFPLLFSRRTSFSMLPGQDAAQETAAENTDSGSREMDELFRLTAAEKRVYQLVCQGLSNADIAASLQISPNTVKFHMRNILQKAGVKNRRELLALVYNHEWPGEGPSATC